MAAPTPSMRRARSRWYCDQGKASLVSARIASLNLQGDRPEPSSPAAAPASPGMSAWLFGGFQRKELKKTVFIVEVSVRKYSWLCHRSFDEFRDFYNFVRNDHTLGPNKSKLKASFPSGADGEVDVMVLVERREMIEDFLREMVAQIDLELYEPLNLFLVAKENLIDLKNKVVVIARAMRYVLAKRKLNMRLFKFYSKEIMRFVYKMESGIEVFDIGAENPDSALTIENRGHASHVRERDGIPVEQVMWIDVCEEPGLSRLCVAPREVFELPKECEDERLANGVFLSDIAEVRRGAASYGFKTTHGMWIKPAMCVSVVGSERTLDIQLLSQEEMKRFFLIDFLSLLSMQSLSAFEISLRKRKWRRSNPHASVKVVTPFRKSAKRREDCDMIMQLLLQGIEVDEETYSPQYGMCMVPRLLVYQPDERRLLIRSNPHNRTILHPTQVPNPQPAAGAADNSKRDSDVASQLSSSPTGASGMDFARRNSWRAVSIDGERTSIFDGPFGGGDAVERASSASTTSVSPTAPAGAAAAAAAAAATAAASGPSHTVVMKPVSTTSDTLGGDRSIDVNDISEVRPGKISGCADGTEDSCVFTIIASETILCLPVPTIELRNNLIAKFQAFVEVHRDYAGLDSDSPRCFRAHASPRYSMYTVSSGSSGTGAAAGSRVAHGITNHSFGAEDAASSASAGGGRKVGSSKSIANGIVSNSGKEEAQRSSRRSNHAHPTSYRNASNVKSVSVLRRSSNSSRISGSSSFCGEAGRGSWNDSVDSTSVPNFG